MTEGSFFGDIAKHTAQTWSNVTSLNGTVGEYLEAGAEVGLGLLALRYGAGKLLGAADEAGAGAMKAAPLLEASQTAVKPIDTLLANLKTEAAAANFADRNVYAVAKLTDPTHIAQFSEYLGAERPAEAAANIFGAVDRGWVAEGTSQMWLDQTAKLESLAGTTRLETAMTDLEPLRRAMGFSNPDVFAFTQFRSPQLIESLADKLASKPNGLDSLTYGLSCRWNPPGTTTLWRTTLANLKGQI